MFKKFSKILLVTACFSLLFSSFAFASSDNPDIQKPIEFETVYIDGDAYYLETFISDIDANQNSINATSGTITRTKTSHLYNSAGEIMISVAVTGTFTYNGSTAVCTSCSGSSTSYNSAWVITDYYTSRSGNSATNYTTAVQANKYTYHKNVTITCSADGTIS